VPSVCPNVNPNDGLILARAVAVHDRRHGCACSAACQRRLGLAALRAVADAVCPVGAAGSDSAVHEVERPSMRA